MNITYREIFILSMVCCGAQVQMMLQNLFATYMNDLNSYENSIKNMIFECNVFDTHNIKADLLLDFLPSCNYTNRKEK
jgi:hypothetical protein